MDEAGGVPGARPGWWGARVQRGPRPLRGSQTASIRGRAVRTVPGRSVTTTPVPRARPTPGARTVAQHVATGPNILQTPIGILETGRGSY